LEKEIDIEHLAGLKSYLEKRLAALEKKVEAYKGYIHAIDGVLTRSSFKLAADMLKETPAAIAEKPAEHEATRETVGAYVTDLISRANGSNLGIMTVSKTSITITPVGNTRIAIDSGTFNSFFIRRILSNMVQKDEEEVKSRKLSEKDKISYRIDKNNDGSLKELVITNYRDEDRLKQITTTIRWTLEKATQRSPSTK
jgi:hypothetical protein